MSGQREQKSAGGWTWRAEEDSIKLGAIRSCSRSQIKLEDDNMIAVEVSVDIELEKTYVAEMTI